MNGIEAYEHALATVARNDDGSVNESDLEAAVATFVDFDAEEARRGLAKRIVARRKRPGQTAPEGQLVLPGFDPYSYEPYRLVADEAGHVVENSKAGTAFKAAEARRAQRDADKAHARAGRQQEEYAIFSDWAVAQLSQGRALADITWDNCIRELHMWKESDPEQGDVLDDESGNPNST